MRQIVMHLNKEAETQALGVSLARALKPGMKIYLYGDLGSGKTTFTRAMLQAAGHKDKVKSPTYALAEEYTINADNQLTKLMHFDLFRIENEQEFVDAGFLEDFDNDTICVVEWPEKARDILPQADIEIIFLILGMGRKIKLYGLSQRGAEAIGKLSLDTDD